MINRLTDYLPEQEMRAQGVSSQESAFSLETVRNWIEPAEDMIRKYPAACLASAFAFGVAIAWWIKRT